MKIFLTGYSGFVGRYLNQFFSNNYEVVNIDLRKLNDKYDLNNEIFLKNFQNNDVIINCAASLRPKNKSDFYINSEFPHQLIKHLKNKNLKNKFIHLSSINTTVDYLKDNYSLSKKKCEKLIQDDEVIILRLPLIIEKNNQNELLPNGQLSIFFNYLNFSFLPIYPMVYPGNYFNPIDLSKLAEFILELINSNQTKGTFNLTGNTKYTSWDLFKKIANKKNKRVIKIKTNFINKMIPKILMKIVYRYNF
ncbi:NAD-dependent epimerase/dehydratase family protein, partial [Candidatus Pelagibacter sp.]|nr:NAD-dependent epimerase/dehydratase family protein [Candidatus Pelagibacter sp.]